MKKRFLYLFLLLFVGIVQTTYAQNVSNEGSDFWIPFPTHDPSNGDLANMNVFVTCKYDSEVTVSCGSFYSETKPIPANTIVTFSVPRSGSYIESSEANTVLINRGIHVVTTAGKPNVAVYAHIYAGARSAASLILPKEALGQKYYSMNYTQNVSGRGFLVLVAAENNTTLLIHELNGTTKKVTLSKAGDVYEYMPPPVSDLTGTFVEVDPATSQCKRFAAFAGSTSLAIGCAGSIDPLYQQLYTISSWGKNYGIVPFISRRYILRVLAQEDNTTVNIGGTTSVINKGKYIETGLLTEAMVVSADKLISVAQYSLTQICSSAGGGNIIGDPEMVLLNPTEFNIKNITVFSSNNKSIQTKYVNVFMKTNKTSTFKLNGAAPANGNWQVMPGDATYSYIQIQVFDESLTLTADDGFNAIAYGFGSAESYAYSAGTNLASSQFLVLVDRASKKESSTACLNQTVDFKLTIPYLLDKIVWKLGDGTPDFTDNSPSPTTSVVNGETLYTYTSPVNKTFSTIGQKTLVALATLSASQGACSSSNVEFNFTLQIDPLPIVDFSVASLGCSDNDILFTDKSISNSSEHKITKWVWDFGDGAASNEQNPTHAYAAAGNYTINLYAGTDLDCLSQVATKNITINPKATAFFVTSQNTCINTILKVNDQSSSVGGNIVKWTWDFGDGSGTVNTKNPTHTYTKTGNYVITLIAETDLGCISKPYTANISVTDLPANDFSIPDACLSDDAIFINSSTDYDGTTAGLTYLWNYGDLSSGALNTSTARDGKHKYTAAGDYIVTLTIYNPNGCSVVLAKTFTVNGSSPNASFTPPDASGVCSNATFSATNTSTVDFGKITRIEWFIDGVKYSEDEDPSFGKVYDFNYPSFTTPATKTIMLKMIAYSGNVSGPCKATFERPVILKASPIVEFDALESTCVNGSLIQFTAQEVGQVPGSGQYSGPGVSPSGLFNPGLARVGVHSITYTFTATNGCSDSKTQQIEIYPAPEVDAGADFYILSGGQKQIVATAQGTGLTYKWSPSAGLSRDDVLDPIASPTIDTHYTLTVTSSQGCSLTDQVFVHVLQDINAPNSFTPNGDGVNDVWNVKYLDTYPNATVEIYDRSGQRVYFSKGYSTPFNGYYNNKALPVGTYYYIINPNSGRNRITGDLTIIK